MEYVVTSPTKIFGKSNGEKFTEKELLDLGAQIDVLVASGGLAKNKAPQAVPETKQAPQVFEYKNINNEQGDK
jgi:hypothetical protein